MGFRARQACFHNLRDLIVVSTGRRGKVSDEANASQTKVITGSAAISVTFPGQCCPPDAGFDAGEGGFFFFKNA